MSDDMAVSGADIQERGEYLAAKVFTGGPVKYFEQAGRLQFEVLIHEGLRPRSKVLDVGCGALRAGYWLLHFLEPGCYFGIEPNQTMLQAGIENVLEPGLVDRSKPKFSSREDFDFTIFETQFDFVLARSIWTHASKAQICRMLDSFVSATSQTGVFLTSYRPASLVAVGTSRTPLAERLAARMAIASTAPSLSPLIPGIGERRWDYQDDAWLGQSHRSNLPGMVRHSFRWIARECIRRGLIARELGYGVMNHQRWIRIDHRPS